MPFWNRKTETRLIIGLGNPGEKYADTRHNIGFMCLDAFALLHKVVFTRTRIKAKVGETRLNNLDVVLGKPQTFMNLSGEAVGKLVRQHKVKPENLIVVYDDLDLPVGRIRIRLGGSSGGHKGINSIIAHISSQEFIRVRVGIGRPEIKERNEDDGDGVINHVLSGFSPEEKLIMKDIIPLAGKIVESLLADGLEATMNRYNATDLRKKP
ncbi:MAG: aminoacyl-tRNA hydrolase [Dehalococcoidales bacterium]|nr:aminoacyl-tRNA hydrolase [Dehalococcoidales bacterium]